jgi:uncharacterized membrane protein
MHRDPRRPGFARRTSLAFIPTMSVGAALVAASICFRVDRQLRDSQIPDWLDRGDIDTVRTLLATISGALIGTLALTLTITIVTLQLASSQFGPRLIRIFMRSTITRWTIGVFAATFTFSLATLATVDENSGLVPHVGTTITFALSIAALVMLIFYVHGVAQSIQVPSVLARIAKDLRRATSFRFVELDLANGGRDPREVEREFAAVADQLSADSVTMTSSVAGRLQLIQHRRLVNEAASVGAVIELLHRPGDFVLSQTPIARVSPASALTPELESTLRDALTFGANRTMTQDLEYALDQLVEIGIRALSPAINDTYTGLTCIDWLTESLRQLAGLPLERCLYTDTTGTVRLAERKLRFAGLIHTAFDKLRQAGATNPAILIRLAESLTSIADHVTTEQAREALRAQHGALVQTAAAGAFTDKDRTDINRRLERLDDVFH